MHYEPMNHRVSSSGRVLSVLLQRTFLRVHGGGGSPLCKNVSKELARGSCLCLVRKIGCIRERDVHYMKILVNISHIK